MRKLGRGSGDSLELLLDTVCSMFGAIILIAILVALLAQTVKVESSVEQTNNELLQRRIAAAQADLARAQSLREQLADAPDPAGAALAAEERRLQATVAVLRSQARASGAQLTEQVARQNVNFRSEWERLSADLETIQRQQTSAANATNAQDQEAARLAGRAAEISKLIQHEKETKLVKLRFPKEHAQTKKALAVIFKYGHIYPTYDETLTRNETTIQWQSNGESRKSRPLPERGWTAADQASLLDFLRKVPQKEVYLSFYVYPDSFEIFRATREATMAAGLEFGISIVKSNEDLYWGKTGSTPPPL